MTLPYSDATFVCAFPRECTEAFLEGHVRAFGFFGGVPRRISYDNSKVAVAKVLGGRDRKVTDACNRATGHGSEGTWWQTDEPAEPLAGGVDRGDPWATTSRTAQRDGTVTLRL
jgi:hypothetical protein